MTRPIVRDSIYRRRRFDAEVIELCVRWYITYRLSYRDLVAMMAPIKFLQSPLCAGNPCKRVEIAVGDIMTPLGLLETLEFDWMMRATAGDVASAFASKPYTHMLVMEPGGPDGGRLIRGLLSKTRLERQLGKPIRSLVG